MLAGADEVGLWRAAVTNDAVANDNLGARLGDGRRRNTLAPASSAYARSSGE